MVSWWSKKQTVVARSSTEAKYWNLAPATLEVQQIQTLLFKLKVSHTIPRVFGDNLSTISLAHNRVLHVPCN